MYILGCSTKVAGLVDEALDVRETAREGGREGDVSSVD